MPTIVVSAADAAAAAPKAAAKCPASAADPAAATRAATACQGPVEISSARDEKTQVYANPNGSFTSRTSAVTQRVRGANGAWHSPDPTLRRGADGRIAPAATALDLSFSPGGRGPALTVGKGAAQLSLSWPGVLPAPRVSGGSATYPEVMPGVDLVLTAQVEGFAETLVVKSAAAAANPALAAVRFRTGTRGLKLRALASGGFTAVDGAGATLFGSGTPAMWDSATALEQPGKHASPVVHTRAPKVMPLQLSGADLVVHPDLAMLRDRATRFPVFIDPSVSRTAWTMINSNFPKQSYWSYDRQDCPAPYASIQCAKVGFTNYPEDMIYRSLFSFGISGIRNTHVLDAKFSIDTVYSYTNSNTGTQLRVAGAIDANTTWNSNASSWGATQATAQSHAYDRVRRRTEFGVTGAARTAAGGTSNTLTLGLRAVDEDSLSNWKKFDASTAYLAVTYNAYPNAPDKISIDGSACATGANRPYVRTLTPELRARVSDPDGTARLLKGTFYWWKQSGGARNNTDAVSQGSIVSGQTAITKIPAARLTDGGTYVVQAIANDGLDHGQYSTTCEFTVDVTAPGSPSAVASTDYPADGQAHGGAGTPGTFTISPPSPVPSDFAGYSYTLDPGVSAAAATQVAATSSAPTASVSITPPTDQAFNLRVWSRDKAGNTSADPKIYSFTVRAGTGPDGRWRFDDQTGTDDSDHGNTAALTGATFGTGRGGFGGALVDNGTSTAAVTAGPVVSKDPNTGNPITVHTNGTYTVAAVVKLTSTTGTGQRVIVAQDGAHTSAFQLSYSIADKKWRFAVAATDVAAPTTAVVLSNAAATANVWTNLLATYNGSTHKLALYVNGTLQTATATTTTFDATGGLSIGRGLASGAASGFFAGSIDDVRLYNRALITTEREFTNSLRPSPPLITFPNGTAGYTGKAVSAVVSAGGDTAVTKIQYRLDAAGTWTTVTLAAAGGTATVSVTPTVPGQPALLAQGLDAAGRISDLAAQRLSITLAPAVSGTVVNALTGTPVAGATVTLNPGALTQTTSATGAYAFSALTAGTYTITATTGGNGCTALTADTDVDVDTATTLGLFLAPQSDLFGYSCTTATNTPFLHVSTPVDLSSSSAASVGDLPFAFPYYGSTFTTAWVTSDGILSFRQISAGPSRTVSLPDRTNGPLASIVPFWGDYGIVSWEDSQLYTGTVGTGADARYVIEWRDAEEVWGEDSGFSFEIVLAPNGDITFNYEGVTEDEMRGTDAAVGITSIGGGYGIQYLYDSPDLASNQSITFAYPSDPQPIPLHTVSGTLTAHGAPLSHGSVRLGSVSGRADEDGHFTFANVEDGTYTVEGGSGCDIGSAPDVDVTDDVEVDVDAESMLDGFGYLCDTAPTTYLPGDTPVDVQTDTDADIALPFAFPYYGKTFTTASLSWSGGIYFTGDQSTGYESTDFYLGADWVDGQSAVLTKTIGTAPHRQFVVEWRDLTLPQKTDDRISFETVLDEDGTITMNYADPSTLSDLAFGLQCGIFSGSGQYMSYGEDGRTIPQGRSVVFRPPAAS